MKQGDNCHEIMDDMKNSNCYLEASENEMVQTSFLDSEFKTKSEKNIKKPQMGGYKSIKRDLEALDDKYKILVDITKITSPKKRYNFIDLFSGAGGMSLGMEQAGFNSLISVEMVDIACETFKYNFPNCKLFHGDIHDFSATDLLKELGTPEVELIVGGPPCQGFSVAGKRDPKDHRNSLFEEYVRVVEEVRPWYFVMENVPGLLTMANGKFKNMIINRFSEIGYKNVSIAVLEAAEYGIPQFRSRVIFIGNRFNLPNPYPKPILDAGEYIPIEEAFEGLPDWERIPKKNHEWTKHSKKTMERISKVAPGGSLYDSFIDAYKRQYPGIPSMTVKENHGGTHIHPSLNRCISAREMARLQSFPDEFFFKGSMKKAMWQIGNAVPPKLARSIGYGLIPFLNSIEENSYDKFRIKQEPKNLELF